MEERVVLRTAEFQGEGHENVLCGHITTWRAAVAVQKSLCPHHQGTWSSRALPSAWPCQSPSQAQDQSRHRGSVWVFCRPGWLSATRSLFTIQWLNSSVVFNYHTITVPLNLMEDIILECNLQCKFSYRNPCVGAFTITIVFKIGRCALRGQLHVLLMD